jgi:hypothetical protein
VEQGQHSSKLRGWRDAGVSGDSNCRFAVLDRITQETGMDEGKTRTELPPRVAECTQQRFRA